MKVRGGGRRLFLLGVMVFAGVALLAPGGAAAANVVNGDFETGTLAGWQVHQATELGNWFAYKGTDPPISGKKLGGPIQAPPQGERGLWVPRPRKTGVCRPLDSYLLGS